MFDAGPWGEKYPNIAASWRRNWERVSPFFNFPPEIRRIIYTTNAPIAWHAARAQLALKFEERFTIND